MATAILDTGDGTKYELPHVDLTPGVEIRARIIRRGLFGWRSFVRLEVVTPRGRRPYVVGTNAVSIKTTRD